MAGLAVGIIGAGGVGVADRSALIMRALPVAVTVYATQLEVSCASASPSTHARSTLLAQVEVALVVSRRRSSTRTVS